MFALTLTKPPPELRAWACVWAGLPHVTAHYRARTRSKARYLAAMDVKEVFGASVGAALRRIRVTRAPQYDHLKPSIGATGLLTIF